MIKKLCFKCLGSGHISKQCLPQIKCFKCGRHHHVALCIDTQNSNLQNQSHHNQSEGQLTSVAEATSEGQQSVLLQIASTQVLDNKGNLHNCRILFDNCSQLSYISSELHSKLKDETLGTKEICIKTFGNNNTTEILEKVELRIKCLFGRTIRIVYYVKDICSPLNGQYINLASEKYKHLHNLKLADSNLRNGSIKIDVLVGANFY